MFPVVSFLLAVVSTENALRRQWFFISLSARCHFWHTTIVQIWAVFKIAAIMTELLHYVFDVRFEHSLCLAREIGEQSFYFFLQAGIERIKSDIRHLWHRKLLHDPDIHRNGVRDERDIFVEKERL